MRASLITGDDGLARCWWAGSTPDYSIYHDREWGRPVTDDRGLYERLTLEAFQSGLSWLTILRKREGFRAAFAGFEIERVAAFAERDFARLMADASIVRNRLKIEAAIANARALAAMHRAGESLAELVWAQRSDAPLSAPRGLEDIPSSTPGSKQLATQLKARGFRFVGPTTMYAALQACGIVNDHLLGCCVRDEVERLREGVVLHSR
jgi:DNA-3-methyladenine glycosylase I